MRITSNKIKQNRFHESEAITNKYVILNVLKIPLKALTEQKREMIALVNSITENHL